MDIQSLKQLLKDGKGYYNIHNYDKAVDLYTHIIETIEKTGSLSEPIQSLLVKAYQKRVFAKQKQGNYKGADEDLKTVRNILHK